MNGPPLAPAEAAALVKRRVNQFEAAGMSHYAAVVAAATTLRVKPYNVAVIARGGVGES